MGRCVRGATPLATVILMVVALACAGNRPTGNLSPTGLASYQAIKVVKALDLVRDVAVEGEKQSPKLISPQVALKVISYHRQVVRTIGAVPTGWKSVAVTGLEQLKTDIPADEWKRLEPFINLLKALYLEVQ